MKKYRLLNVKFVGPLIAVVTVALLLSSVMAVFFGGNDVDATGVAYKTKRQTTTTLTMASSSVVTNQNMHADGLLKYQSGLANVLVTLEVILPDGTVTSPTQGSSTYTDGSGKFSMDYVPTAVGTYVFKATYSGNSRYLSSSASQSFTATQASQTNTTTQPQAIRWTWLQSPSSDIAGQSYVYSVKFEVQYTNGAWYGAGTTGIDYTFKNPNGVATVLRTTTPADTTGISSVSISPNIAGNWTVVCDWDHNNQIYAWDSSPVRNIIVSSSSTPVVTAQSTAIVLNGPTSAITGNAQTVSGVLKTSTGTTIGGATVTVQVTNPDGSKSATTSKVTGIDGSFTYAMTPSVAGTYRITATYAGDTTHNGSASSMSFTASTPAPTPTATYDYIVSSSQVKNAAGTIVYTGSSFTVALQWAASQAGKTIFVPAGTYTVNAMVKVANGVTIYGAGSSGTGTVFDYTVMQTWLHQADANSDLRPLFYVLDVSNVALKSFRMTNHGIIVIAASDGVTISNFLVQDVTAWYTSPSGSWMGAFTVLADKKRTSYGGVVDGAKFVRCQAIHTGLCGFMLFGWSTNVGAPTNGGWIKNTVFESCVADHCGSDPTVGRYGDFCVAYDLAEQVNIQTLTLNNCQALYGWEDGFHFEMWPIANNVVFNNCTANYNGVKPSAYFGQGFFWVPGQQVHVTLNSCTGIGNKKGSQAIGYSDCPIADLPPVG